MRIQTFAIFLAATALFSAGIVAYMRSPAYKMPVVFSSRMMLADLWQNYKTNYWDSETGSTVDPSGTTTSEAESYTMLRAVWMDDKPTFDKSLAWIQSTLMHRDDHLFSWLYGKKPDGTYGVLTDKGGEQSASDADTDVALSLVFAYARWQEPTYLGNARATLNDIWNNEVVLINGKPYMTADNIERFNQSRVIVNPSYFEPYAYRIFAKVDPAHDWNGLVDTSYDVIAQSAELPLDRGGAAGLPPDWVAIDRATGDITPASEGTLTSNYGYDAMRVPWRLAVDWLWFGEPRAKTALQDFGFLGNSWRGSKSLDAVYSHDGGSVAAGEATAVYGGDIGYFLVADRTDAAMIYATKLKSLYDPDTRTWTKPLDYYDASWAWFGMGLYNNELANLASGMIAQSDAANKNIP